MNVPRLDPVVYAHMTPHERVHRAELGRMQDVLTATLGLTWRGMSGEPDGSEIAADCAEALYAAGFRLTERAA